MQIAENISLAYLEAKGLAKCLEAYAKYFASEDIFEIGFNDKTGYVYIVLESNAIQIASAFGQDVEYVFFDFETGEEFFYESFEDYEKERICSFDI
jgi:hypothetical protein